MATHQQLSFLQHKIQEIGSAIFFNLSDNVLKLPTSVVSTLKVDDFGLIWFFVQKPRQNITEFEADFPVRLDFFKKGTNSFLQVTGKGWVVTDPEEKNALDIMPEEARQLAMKDLVLVKVKMLKAEYYEPKASARSTWWQSAVNAITSLFRNNGYRPDTYYPAS